MVELITKQSALDAIDKESEFIEREINDATKHPDEYTDNFISFSRERQCGLADAYIAVDELSPVETMTDGDLISRQAAVSAIYNIGIYMGRKDAMDALKALPSPQPIHVGWVKNNNGIYVCGNCGYMPSSEGYTYYHYCPNCGVKVRSTINE